MSNSRNRRTAVLLTLAVLGVVEWLASNAPRLGPTDVNRVQIGMTRAEVEAVLGQPPTAEGPPSRSYTSATLAEAEGATWVVVWPGSHGLVLHVERRAGEVLAILLGYKA